jgi:hypothetical protein
MLLDVGVSISCYDLAFMHSVWRSSQLVPVGLIPRIHAAVSTAVPTGSRLRPTHQQANITSDMTHISSIDGKTSSGDLSAAKSINQLRSFEFLGGVHVWWHKKYSLLLSKAIMFRSHDMKVGSLVKIFSIVTNLTIL